MGEICRKDSLARNMWKVSRHLPDDFDFVPNSWVLPGEYAMFQFHARENKKKKSKTFIRKPVNGAMGHGIWLTRNIDKIQPNDTCIIQEYLDKPLLMDGYKFDLRIYVLVLSCDPLKVFLYKDGLVRMSTTPYDPPSDSNVSDSYMHLTNYSINKHSENFIHTSLSEQGTKRTLKYFWKWLHETAGNVETVWGSIKDVVNKTLLVAMPHIFHAYHMCRGGDPKGSNCCFEVLGFDIFIDRKYKPWVLEVNRAPSFGTDQDLDYEIKYGVLSSTLKLLNIKSSDKRHVLRAEKMEAQRRLVGTPGGRRSASGAELTTNREKIISKRKKELRWRLNQVRSEAKRKEYEEKTMGDFVRIYPPQTKELTEHYDKLLCECTKAITGRKSLQKEHNPIHRLKEEEILDLLQEVENDVLHAIDEQGRMIPRGPPPLSSMPSASPIKKRISPSTSTEKIGRASSTSRLSVRTKPNQTLTSTARTKRPSSARLVRETFSAKVEKPVVDETRVNKTKEALKHLKEMKIKFPGKSDEEAQSLLSTIQDNWKLHRPRVAAYWLVKLDALKRRKVIDIVKGNVSLILQRMWQTTDIEALILYRMFAKLFNRLLWSHGQGLWNCFSATGDSWESIFLKSAETFLPVEIDCCRQVVKLCKDCLLVVYQFAAETTTIHLTSSMTSSSSMTSPTPDTRLQCPHTPNNRKIPQSRSVMHSRKFSSTPSLNGASSHCSRTYRL
ncbi:tubulin polyglutamylase TTLL7-like [Clytia hemisphaerica]